MIWTWEVVWGSTNDAKGSRESRGMEGKRLGLLLYFERQWENNLTLEINRKWSTHTHTLYNIHAFHWFPFAFKISKVTFLHFIMDDSFNPPPPILPFLPFSGNVKGQTYWIYLSFHRVLSVFPVHISRQFQCIDSRFILFLKYFLGSQA